MAQNEAPIIQKASNLLNYCVQNNDWEPDYSNSAIIAFANASQNDPEIEEYWFVETAEVIIYHLLDLFKEELAETKSPVPIDYAIRFAVDFRRSIQINVVEHWLILPIHRAKLKNPIEFGNYIFIPSHLSRNEKLQVLAEKSSISLEVMSDRADHTEKTRSKSFFEYTLMCRKILHQNSFVHTFGRRIVLLDFAILRLLKHASILQSSKNFDGISLDEHLRDDNRHILINTENPSGWGHIPFWADSQSTTILGDLDWLENETIQAKFIEIENVIGYMTSIDRLAFRFRRAAMFFSRAIDLQHATHKRLFEGYGLETLHLMIAAESLLLDREAEKRLRLATLISRLLNIDGFTSEELFLNVNTCYNWRSDYVHSGNDIFPEYDENFREGQIQKSMYLLRHMLGKLISEAPSYLRKIEQLIYEENLGQITDRTREKAWFKYLDNLWLAILTGAENNSN